MLLKLGTNDAKFHPFKEDVFRKYASEMIDAFNGDARVVLLVPVPIFREQWGMRGTTLSNVTIPTLEKVARSKAINFYKSMMPYKHLFPDGVHPNAIGYSLMAHQICLEMSRD